MRAAFVPREARTADYRPGAGVCVAMLGDSTVRDFAIGSSFEMLAKQWLGNQRNPFLNGDPSVAVDSIFERLARRGPARAVEYARSGASVGPPRTLIRRQFQWLANVRTLDGQIRELLAEPVFPDLVLVWIGHNNLDFVTECSRFSSRGDLDEACEGIRRVFSQHFRADLQRLLQAAHALARRTAIVVYGLVNPEATRRARDRARALRAARAGLFPYMQKSEQRFPPLRPEHGDRLLELSRALSFDMRREVEALQASFGPLPQVRLSYSDATARVELCEPNHLHEADAWHASEAGKRLLADALFEGISPALPFIGR